jgi:competence protein ComEC
MRLPTNSLIRPSTPQVTKFLIGFLCITALLIVRVAFLVEAPETAVTQSIGSTVVVAGSVGDDPDKRATSLRVTIDAKTINNKEGGGRFIAILPRETELHYGDTVEVRGNLTAPDTFETATGRVFDYPGYLSVHGVTALMQRATLRTVSPGGWSLTGSLLSVKHAFESALERVMDEPDVSLMEGLILGEKRGLPDFLTQAFIFAGLIHVVVLSGFNMSVVSEAVLRFFGSFLPRTLALSSGAFAVVLFALMSGGGAATVRACIMGLIAILARYMRRPTVALRTLMVAAVVMIIWNPLVVLYDTGFILSILATFGLITISPVIEQKILWIPNYKHFDLRSIAASTMSVQIFVLPALLYLTGVLSVFALPANVLALPVVPFAMLFGFVAGLLALVHPVLALVPALLGSLLVKWMLLVATTAASLPLSSATVEAFPLWVALVAYIPLTGWAVYCYRRSGKKLFIK